MKNSHSRSGSRRACSVARSWRHRAATVTQVLGLVAAVSCETLEKQEELENAGSAPPTDTPAVEPLPLGTSVREALNTGADLIEAERYEEALVYLARARTSFPSEPSLAENMALASEKLERHADRLQHCLEFHRLVPQDPKGLEMVIRAYQATGDREARDDAIAKLIALRESSLTPQLRRKPVFLRDNFEVNGDRVLTLASNRSMTTFAKP